MSSHGARLAVAPGVLLLGSLGRPKVNKRIKFF